MNVPEKDDPGLLSRWSRRKAQARAGGVAPETAPAPPAVAEPAAAPAPPLPTLADVAALGPDADYSRFVLPGVSEDVKRAAVKKLFLSDPRFNVMDGLDVYIDDYGQPDPIPEAMLRRMTQSRLLGLFDQAEDAPQATADGTPAPSLPQSPTAAALAAPEPADEDPALRLQPDDAADAAGARADRPHPRG